MADRWKLVSLRRHVVSRSIEELMAENDSTTLDYLSKELGLSMDCIDRFLRPWFGGVFFERDLATSSRFFRFIFKMFSLGDASLPENGMKSIPEQLLKKIPADNIRLNTPVKSVAEGSVHLDGGEKIEARAVVLAVNGVEAARLSGEKLETPPFKQTACVYFGTEKPVVREPILVLNGEGKGPINNMCVPSLVSPSYAPPGKSLVSVSVIDPEAIQKNNLEKEVRQQLRDWFGAEVDLWYHLRTFRITHALPSQPVGFLEQSGDTLRIREGLYACGDYRATASIHGAMLSGRLAAEAIIKDHP